MPKDNTKRTKPKLPCPCPNRICRGGKLRDIRTIDAHQKLQNAQQQLRDRRLVDVDVEPPQEGNQPDAEPVDPDLDAYLQAQCDEYIKNPLEDVPGCSDPIAEDDASGHQYPILGDVILQAFDWVSRHQSTKSSASDMWDFIRSIIPPDDTMGTYASVQAVLKNHRMETMQKTHVCVNMCVAYVNPVSKELQGEEFQNADEDTCPVCTEPRYLADGCTPRRVVYNLPMKFWLQDLFARRDVVPHLLNNLPPTNFPSGHVRRSEGYRQKVTSNPNINSEPRNQALSLSADGLPYFKDRQSAGGWAVSLTDECLAEGNMAHNASFVHMAVLVPSEYYSQVKATAKIVKTKRYTNHFTMYGKCTLV
jgi:NAD-dependent dihydropyrimidine dehydrogenase PreA subunit